MSLKSYLSTLAVLALIACSDSGTGSSNKDEGSSSGSGSSSHVGASSNSGGHGFGDFDYGTISVNIDGQAFKVDSVTANAPLNLGSDSGLSGMVNNTMYLTAIQWNNGLDDSELMISVKNPVDGANDAGSLTSLYRVYTEDSTRMWMKSENSTVNISSIDASGAKGTYDLTLSEICFMCEADSVVHVTGSFDVNFEQ